MGELIVGAAIMLFGVAFGAMLVIAAQGVARNKDDSLTIPKDWTK